MILDFFGGGSSRARAEKARPLFLMTPPKDCDVFSLVSTLAFYEKFAQKGVPRASPAPSGFSICGPFSAPFSLHFGSF